MRGVRVGGLCVSEQENAHELRNEMRKGSNLRKSMKEAYVIISSDKMF